MPIEISIVLPVSNEVEVLRESVEKILAYTARENFEIIIAEDGSTDGTDVLASKLAKENKSITHIHQKYQLGRGQALKNAFKKCKGKTLMYMDIDLSTDPASIKVAIEKIKDFDIVVGSRLLKGSRVQRSYQRAFLTLAYNWLVRVLLRSKIKDYQCGFKAFRRDVVMKLIDDVKAKHWAWDTELLVKAQRQGFRICEIPVTWIQTPRHTKVKPIKDPILMGLQLFRLWWELNVR